jgi:hypothetical protein
VNPRRALVFLALAIMALALSAWIAVAAISPDGCAWVLGVGGCV